jgi:serine/threonine protein kinase
VTVVDEKRVYKEFCYYLRQKDGFNNIPIAIKKQDQRLPPPMKLLKRLGKPYSDWVCEEYAGGWFVVLEYDFIQGDQRQVTKTSWMSLLSRVATLHNSGYVHGDILPRNMLFSADEGYIIDFDLMREEGQPYVLGYNHMDFEKYRHPDAQARNTMKKIHDVHALIKIGIEHFGEVFEELCEGNQISSIASLTEISASCEPEESHPVKPADLADTIDSWFKV